jgi:type IV pilus assembly protein PilB
MISNQDPALDEKLQKLWRQSQERQVQAQAARGHYGYLDLTSLGIETDALKMVPEEKARELSVAAFQFRNNIVALAVGDMGNPKVHMLIDEFARRGIVARPFLVSRQSLEYAWNSYKYVPKETKEIASRVDIKEQKVTDLKSELTSLAKVAEALLPVMMKTVAIGDLMEIVLTGALNNRASDIHFESGEHVGRLRYRIDGVLRDVTPSIPMRVYQLIISRIKLLSNLRLNVTNISQDGRFTIGLGGVEVELRTSIIPSEFGETVVMRVLDPKAIELTLADLGLRPDDKKIIEDELKAPNGMILNTGPTGSGKTTTLYAFLRSVANSETKIITIEDPIEYHVKGIEQTQVDVEAGYTFANGLQAMMRQDPDVILVGEIRDKDTAAIAVQAALTGHLVFSTLHTNSAAGVIPRLLDLEAPITSIGPALNLIIAQRLVRKLCAQCKQKVEVTPELDKNIQMFLGGLPSRVDKSSFNTKELYGAPSGDNSCQACEGVGYKGRVAIFELLRADEKIESLIREHAGEGRITEFAKTQGMVTLQQDGILKALSGMTSFAEVEAVTGPILFS